MTCDGDGDVANGLGDVACDVATSCDVDGVGTLRNRCYGDAAARCYSNAPRRRSSNRCRNGRGRLRRKWPRPLRGRIVLPTRRDCI